MLISEEYKKLNEKLHETNRAYGTSGCNWANHIITLAKSIKTEDVLDYGCGKGTLAANLPFDINQYDPAIPAYSARPQPADLVVCGDVLEHIEPEYIDNVLDDLYKLTKKSIFLVIHNGPAKKTLEDGRNAHLIQKNEVWWLGAFLPRFSLASFIAAPGKNQPENGGFNVLEYIIVGFPRPEYMDVINRKEKENG